MMREHRPPKPRIPWNHWSIAVAAWSEVMQRRGNARRSNLVMILFGLSVLAATRAASADVTYDYEGQPFVKYLTPCVNHTYDCVDGHISGWITLDLPPDATGRYSGEHVTGFSFTASGTGLTASFSRTTDGDAYDALVKHWHFKLDHGRITEWAFFAAFNNGVVLRTVPKAPPEQFFLSSMFPGDQSRNGRKFGHTEASMAPLMGRWSQRSYEAAQASAPEIVTVYIWDDKWPFIRADGSVGHAAMKGDDTNLLSTFPVRSRPVDSLVNLSMDNTLAREHNRQATWVYRLTIANRRAFRTELANYSHRTIWSFDPDPDSTAETNCVDSVYHVLQNSSNVFTKLLMSMAPGPFTPAILHDELELIRKLGGPIEKISPDKSQ